jgi:hypothetical protein
MIAWPLSAANGTQSWENIFVLRRSETGYISPLFLLQKPNSRNQHICNVLRTFSIAHFNSFAIATVDLNHSNPLLHLQRAPLSRNSLATLYDIDDNCYVDKGLRLFPGSSKKALASTLKPAQDQPTLTTALMRHRTR